MDEKITPKQQKFYIFLKDFISLHDQAPTFQEIKTQTNVKSNSTILHYLQKLEELKLITRTREARGLELTKPLSFGTIPILGEANAGTPLASGEEDKLGELQIDTRIAQKKGNLYAVRIKGDSMNLQKIYFNKMQDYAILKDNNYAIIDKNASYTFGDTVLAIIDNAATIKVLKKAGNHIALVPNSTNETHSPIYIKEDCGFFINGKVIYALENPKFDNL